MREAAWAPPPDAPPEFTGTLTVERVLSGPSLLTRPEGEPKVMPRLVGTLGKPTKVTTGAHMLVGKEQKHYAWAAKSGTTCAVFFVVEQPNMVAGWPSSLAADSGSGQFVMPKAVPNHEGKGDADLLREWEKYAACVDVLGEKLGFPPDAPGAKPPGALVTRADLIAGLTRAPRQWIGRRITVSGPLTVSGIDGHVDTANGTVFVRFREAPPSSANDKKTRVSCTVADTRSMADWGRELVDCELAR